MAKRKKTAKPKRSKRVKAAWYRRRQLKVASTQPQE